MSQILKAKDIGSFSATLRLVLCVFIFWSFQTQLQAQINNNRFRVNVTSNDMGPCGGANDSWTRVAVTAKNNTVHNFEIAFDLPDGVTYNAGSFQLLNQQGSGDFAVTEVDISNLNAPIFRIARPSDANWQVADRVRFRFERTASCDAVQFSYAGGLFKDAHTITYDDLNGSQTVSDTDPTINSYNFLRAYLAVQNYASVSAEIGDNISRTFEVTNSGNGTIDSFNHIVEVGTGLTSYTLSFNGVVLTPTISGNTYSYAINFSQLPFLGNIGNGNSIFENETVFFEESFTVIGCLDSRVLQQPTWGCSQTETCQIPEPLAGLVILDNGMPNVRVTEISDPARTDLCLATPRTVRISNQSTTAIAYNVEINTGYGPSNATYTTNTANGLFGNDRPNIGKGVDNFRFGTGPILTLPQRANTQFTNVGAGSYFISEDYFTSDPDGPGGLEDLDGDGFFDDMAAGASTDLSYEETNSPLSGTCSSGNFTFLSDYRLNTDVYAQNQCSAFTPTRRALVKYSYFVRQAPNTSAPTDVFNGSPFTVNVQGRLASAGYETLYCNGTRIFSNDPSSSWTVTLNVPDGISLDGTPAGYTQVDANTIVYTTTDLPLATSLNLNIAFPLILNCGIYSGPQEVPISYTTRFECSCFAEDMHCGTITGVRSQCTGACNGPGITSFEAQRETAGWTDDTMSTKVTLDPLVHNLDTYMAKDEMVVRANGVINNANPDNLFFDLSYSTASAGAGGPDIIDFLNGTITIDDISSPGTQSIAINPSAVQLITDSPNNYRIRFDLSGYTNIISPTYTYGEPTVPLGTPENDLVHLELHFEYADNFAERVVYELENFNGEFFNNDILGNKVGCNILGDRAYYFKNRIIPYDRTYSSAIGCTPNYVELLAQVLTAPGGDKYPNEYRPHFNWDYSDIEIPAGASFTGLVTSADFLGPDPSTTNGGLTASQIGNIIRVTPTASALSWDTDTNHYPRIRIYFQGSSASAPSTTINWTTNYKEFFYSDTPVDRSLTDTHRFDFLQPNFNITTMTPIVSGDGATATFQVYVCGTNSSAVPFNWLQIGNGSDFTVLRAYQQVGIPVAPYYAEVPFSISSSSGNTWVEFGSLSSNGCQTIFFEVDFNQCSNFDFVVENAWDCNGYPSDFTAANYLNPTTLRLEPKEAVLQINILDEPSGPVDICSNFDIDLELRNAGNGDLINPSVTFDIPGDATSLLLNAVNVEYPQNSGDIQTVSSNLVGNTVTLNLTEHTAIGTNNGIRGSLNAGAIEEQIVLIELDLSVQCNFTSNTAITYEAFGSNTCGTPATGNGSRLSTNPIEVTGALATYDAISTLTVPSGGLFEGCVTETITVETIVVGGPTSDQDYARVILPDGLSFDPTTFVSNNTAYPITYSSVSTVGNHEEFIVNMPDGANNGANPSYSFDVAPKNTTSTCSPGTTIQVNNFVVTSALTCGSVSCGSTEIANGSTFENIIIAKPELVQSSFTTNADYTTDGTNYTYDVAFGIENIGTVAIAAGFTYDVYCTDGSGSKVGPTIYSSSIAQSIPAGSEITENINFSTTNFCGDSSNILVEFVPSDTNCHCDVLSILIASEPEIADLEITNTVAPTNVLVGDTVTFTIEVFNQGPFIADGVVVENLIPVGYTLQTINDGGTLTGDTIEWPTIDNLLSGSSTTLSFTATVNEPTGTLGEFESIAQVIQATQYDSDSDPNNYNGTPLEDDEAIASVHVLTADMNITKGLSATSSAIPTIGETVRFEIAVTNDGPDTANMIVIEDLVPSGFTINTATISNGGVLAGNAITWNIASLNTSSNTILSYDATVNIPAGIADEFINIAQVKAVSEYDPNSTPDNYDANRAIEDDEAVHITSIQTADLELVNTIAPTTADPGDAVLVSIEITNNGPNDATDVSIENIVPVGLSVTNISNSGVQSENTITWNLSNIPNGTSLTLFFDATVNIPTNVTNEYLNTAQVTASDQYDLDSFPNNDDGDQSEDDEDSALLLPITADLSLIKGLSATSNVAPNTGDTVTFELVLTNSGPDTATNVTIEDVIPSGFTLSTLNDGGLVAGNVISWVIPSFAVGTQTLSYDVVINTPTSSADEYTNIAQVTTVDQYDPNSSPNNDDGDQSEDDETSYTIAPPTVDIEIVKNADKTQSYFEDTIVFTVTATNNSVYEATNIGIEDVLPAGFILVSQTTDLGAYDETISTWEIPALASGVSATLTMTVTVTETADYTNIAELIYLDQIDDNTANDRDEIAIIVTQEECLTVFNEFSPNNDGANDTFFIECIDEYPNNTLQVFNRWGTKVFEMKSYDNTWDGTSTGRATISESEKLPVGTYYYTLEPGDGTTPPKAGWLYISR